MAIDFKRVAEKDRADVAAHFGQQVQAAHAKPANKFGAVKTEASGRVHDSKREAARYQQLEAMERTGLISCLENQIDIPLSVNGVLLGYYRADFRYKTQEGVTVIEDAKGRRTEMYKWKRKHAAAEHGITILET